MRAGTMLVLGALALITMAERSAQAVYPEPVTRGGLTDSDAREAERMIDSQRFDVALPLLQAAVARHPGNADLHNALGYTLRKLGRLDESHAHYAKALDIAPDHRAAREYLGELFLMRNEPERALEQLAALKRLCPAGCEERTELEKALQARGVALN